MSSEAHKANFYQKLNNVPIKKIVFFLRKNKMKLLIDEVKQAKITVTTDRERWILRTYDVMTIKGIDQLIFPITKKNPDIKFYCEF